MAVPEVPAAARMPSSDVAVASVWVPATLPPLMVMVVVEEPAASVPCGQQQELQLLKGQVCGTAALCPVGARPA
jgi:hypothetical protein